MSMKFQDESGALVPVSRNLPTELFLDFERRDEDQIVAELMGAAVEEYVYSFKQGNGNVTGLSLTGVMAVAQNMGGITCGPPKWEISEDEYYCEISATDHHRGVTVWGNASQERIQRTRNGTVVDKFARQKALSKAQRNAIRKVIPEAIATEMLKAFLNGQRPSQLRQQPRQAARVIPPQNEPQDANYAATEVIDADSQAGSSAGAFAPITEAQRKRIFATADEHGWADDEVKRLLYETFEKESTKELTIDEASRFISILEQGGVNQPALT